MNFPKKYLDILVENVMHLNARSTVRINEFLRPLYSRTHSNRFDFVLGAARYYVSPVNRHHGTIHDRRYDPDRFFVCTRGVVHREHWAGWPLSVRDRLNAFRRAREPATQPRLNIGSPTFPSSFIYIRVHITCYFGIKRGP